MEEREICPLPLLCHTYGLWLDGAVSRTPENTEPTTSGLCERMGFLGTYLLFFLFAPLFMLNSLTDLAFGELRECQEDRIPSCLWRLVMKNNEVVAEGGFFITPYLVNNVVSIHASKSRRKSSSFSSTDSSLSIPSFIQ